MTAVAERTPSTETKRSGVKDAAKSVLRGWGVLTAAQRPLPDLLMIGAKRAASTSLWNHVVRHPDVLPMFPARQRIKGTSYFTTEFWRGERWYRSHFPTRAQRRRHGGAGVSPVAGESTPYYLFHPLAPERARATVPEARIIAILRNPVDRAYSHYRERVRHGAETATFAEALDAEEGRLAGEVDRILADRRYASVAHEDHSYVAQGRYAEMFERWFAAFPRDQVLVIVNEAFDVDPDAELARVFDHLGIRPWSPPTLKRYNFHPSDAMDPAIRAHLLETFRDENRRLEGLLGIDLSVWDR